MPHGAANAAVLPHVLAFYLDNGCVDQLADLAIAMGAVSRYTEHSRTAADRRRLGEAFITTVRAMNEEMGIKGTVKGMSSGDVDRVATRALVEAHGSSSSPFELRDIGYASQLRHFA